MEQPDETRAGTPPEAERPPDATPPAEPAGCLGSLDLWATALALAPFSPTFYRTAGRRRVIGAIGFLVLLAIFLTIFQSIGLFRNTLGGMDELRAGLESAEIPEVTIANGRATVDAPQPYVLFDQEGTLAVLDTTGTYTLADVSRYDVAFILTEYTLIMKGDDGDIQEAPLSELNAVFGDPIVVNEETIASFVQTFLAAFSVIAVISIFLWAVFGNLFYVVAIGLVYWGIASLVRKGTGFAIVLITGIYALVPPLVARFLLGQFNVRFPGLFTLLYLPLFGAALAIALLDDEPGPMESRLVTSLREPRPLRVWRALVAVPLLIDIALDSSSSGSSGASRGRWRS
jgi:hypothetical protein